MEAAKPYNPTNKVRVVSAASLFDGHDAAINIMRRIIQRTGQGGNPPRSRQICRRGSYDCYTRGCSSNCYDLYQGGHNEYFRYMKDLLDERGAGHIKIFGGGGGTILPEEINHFRIMA